MYFITIIFLVMDYHHFFLFPLFPDGSWAFWNPEHTNVHIYVSLLKQCSRYSIKWMPLFMASSQSSTTYLAN